MLKIPITDVFPQMFSIYMCHHLSPIAVLKLLFSSKLTFHLSPVCGFYLEVILWNSPLTSSSTKLSNCFHPLSMQGAPGLLHLQLFKHYPFFLQSLSYFCSSWWLESHLINFRRKEISDVLLTRNERQQTMLVPLSRDHSYETWIQISDSSFSVWKSWASLLHSYCFKIWG